MYIDTHAHLYMKEFQADLDEVIGRAVDAGVDHIVCPGTDLETSRESVAIADKYPMVYACVGIHPHDAAKADEAAFAEIEKLSRHSKVVAIGEIGLDYHYDFSPRDVQRQVFSAQIDIARARDLPVVIHSREAESDTLAIIEQKLHSDGSWRSRLRGEHDRYPSPKGVFHCFPGDAQMAWKVIQWGFFISMPGPVTYGSKPGKVNLMAEVAKVVSAEHIMTETDSPYLAPVPHRGKRNEPAYVPLVAKRIAELQGLSVEDIARAGSFAAHKLFGIGKYPEPVIAYRLRDSLYLNITIRCDADCVFCDRKGEAVIKGYNLRIEKEPTAAEVIGAIGDPAKYQEIVFCGYGEPTIRLDVVKDVSRWVKSKGGRVRLNTDGHGSVINKRNIVPELAGLVDSVSISLNDIDPKRYGDLMRIDGETFFPALVEFARGCVKHGLAVTMTIVDRNGADEEKARRFVETEIGAAFKNRPYF